MKAKLEIIGSMAAFGTIGAFVRHIPLPSGELALYRALIAAGAIFLWQLCTVQGTGIKDAKAELHLLILSGAAIDSNGRTKSQSNHCCSLPSSLRKSLPPARCSVLSCPHWDWCW